MKKRTRLLLILVAALCLCLGFGVFAACKNEPKKHVHEYTAWAHDGTYHWKECPVDEAADESTREEHTMADGKCTVCGYQEAPAAHVHKYTNLVSDQANHWYECPEDNDYIAQFGHIYDAEGKCIVCGKEGTAPADAELDEREWYVVGNGAGSLLNLPWDKLTGKMTKAEQPDSNGYTVYSYRLTLYAGDQFKLVQDLDWDEGLGYYSLGEVANTAGVFQDGGTGNIMLSEGKDGIYEFYIRTKPDAGPTSVMVEFRLVEEIAPLKVEEQFDMYIIGHLHCTNALDQNTQWKTDPAYMVKLNLMADGKTFYTVVELWNNDEFKVYNLKSNAYFPDGTGNNLKPAKTALYVVTWKIGDRNPVWEEYHHVHNYSDYKHDANEHWCVCVQDGEMDENYGKVAHEFGDDNFCDVCGYEKLDAPECETHTWGTDNVCTVCGRHLVYTEGLKYKINAKRDGYYVVGLHEDTDPATIKEIVVPNYYNKRPVIGIADNAFYDQASNNSKHSTIQRVILPDTVKTIGMNAFRQLVNLNYLKLGAGVEEIGDSAFRDCRYVRAINLPEGLKAIDANAFNGIWFTELTVPSTVTAIGNGAFQATYLTDLKFAEGSKLESIGQSAFSGCAYLKEVALPETVTSVGASAFASCSSLTSLTLPTAAPWKYAASASTADWIALGDATAEDPAATATWLKANAANYLMITEAHEHNFKLGFNGTQHWYRCTICDALEAAKQAHKIFDMQCSVCGFEHTEHTYSETSWASDESGHWHECPLDGTVEAGSKTAHSYNSSYRCTICKYRHTHTYADNWSYDETNHWKDATCGHEVKNGNAAHTFGDDNICTRCGYERIVQGENNGTPDLAFEFNEDYTGLIVTGFKKVPESLTVLEIPEMCGTWPVMELGDGLATALKKFASTVTKVVIPNTVKIVRASMFRDFTVLSDLTIGSSVYKMGDNVFRGCTSLQSVALPESLYQIGAYAFDGCTSLKTINLEHLTYIGEYGFRNCSQLNNVKFGEGLTMLRGYTFQNCTSLDTVDLGGVVDIGYAKLEGYTYRKEGQVFENCGFTTLTLPDNLNLAADSNFSKCVKLKSVTFGKNTRINASTTGTFSGCTSLDTVNFENLASYGSSTFTDCGFTTLTFDFDCGAILGNYLFQNCKKLTTATLKGTYSKTSSSWNNFFQGCTALTTVNLPDDLPRIPGSFFSGCTSLRTFTVPAGVTEILDYAFYNCEALTTVNFGTSKVTKFGTYVFSGCKALTQFTVPATVTSLGNYAFKGCTNLATIDLGKIETMGNNVFDSCTSLTSVTFPGTLKAIGEYAFKGCEKTLKTVTFNSGLETIGRYAFQNCTEITSITLPETIVEIQAYAFYGCTGLTTIRFPASVKKIGITAFQNSGLTSAYFAVGTGWKAQLINSSTTIDDDIFSDPTKAAAQLLSKGYSGSSTTYNSYYLEP